MTSISVVPFGGSHVAEAAGMFTASLRSLRQRVPALPAALAEPVEVERRLAGMSGVAAVTDGRLMGYLVGWSPIPAFRRTARIGAYVPEWGHGAVGAERPAVYAALYRAACGEWSAAGCEVHAITLLAHDDEALRAWSWSGFGMGTVDAIRPTTSLELARPGRVDVRLGTQADATALAELDREHVRHYAEAPVLMATPAAFDERAWEAFFARAGNAVWVAKDGAGPYGFIRFDREFHGSDTIESPTGVFISGAYVRPSHRRRGAAVAMLDAAMPALAAAGVTSCGVDFEAFNPEAAAFWPRHFKPVCYSLMRVPEVPFG